MPSLKLSNPFRRGGHRPSLKDRAAALKTAAARVMRRPTPPDAPASDDVDWHSPPAGFMAYPAIEPQGFINISRGILLEAKRLLEIAEAEFHRRSDALGYASDDARRAGQVERLRRSLRLDALAVAAFPDMPEPAGQVEPSGTVFYEDATGKARRRTVADWIAFTAQRLYSVAVTENRRRFIAGCVEDQNVNRDLNDSLRRELRLDALHDLAFRSGRAFEASKEYAVGRAPVGGLPQGSTGLAASPSPVLVAMVEEWAGLSTYLAADEEQTDADLTLQYARLFALQRKIYDFHSTSLADLCAKGPVLLDEFKDIDPGRGPDGLPEYLLWRAAHGVLRDLSLLAGALPAASSMRGA